MIRGTPVSKLVVDRESGRGGPHEKGDDGELKRFEIDVERTRALVERSIGVGELAERLLTQHASACRSKAAKLRSLLGDLVGMSG